MTFSSKRCLVFEECSNSASITWASRVSRPCGPAIVSGRVRRENCASSRTNGSPAKWSPWKCVMRMRSISLRSISSRFNDGRAEGVAAADKAQLHRLRAPKSLPVARRAEDAREQPDRNHDDGAEQEVAPQPVHRVEAEIPQTLEQQADAVDDIPGI